MIEQRIYRSRTSGGPYELIKILDNVNRSYLDSGLINGKSYYYVVRAYDGVNESPNSNEASGIPIDNTPPLNINVTVSSVSTTSVTVTWTTNELTYSQVEYGTTTSYGSTSFFNSTLRTDHVFGLSGLLTSTTYHYRVISKDPSGNVSASNDFTFTTASNSATWSIETIDSPGSVGMDNSIALDNTGAPHISYRDNTNFNLKYAKRVNDIWQIQTVDNSHNITNSTSIAVDTFGNPYIAYFHATDRNLKYVKWTGSSWTLQTVDSNIGVGDYKDLALDNAGNAHISYHDYINKDLKYAKWNGSVWLIQIVDSTGDVGQFNSIVLDSAGNPHISYYDTTNKDLKYAKWNGSSWVVQTVESNGDAGASSSITLDNAGNPHIAYYNGAVKYARWSESSWIIQTVDVGGGHISIALDSLANPHISYLNIVGSTRYLKYARWVGSGWVTQIVSNDIGSAGTHGAIAIDSSRNPHISYFGGLSDLRYAKKIGQAPFPPSEISATDSPSDQGTEIILSWTPSTSTDVIEQHIYRSTIAGGPYNLVTFLNGNLENNYIDSGLINGVTYYYIIRAYNGIDESNNSNEASASPIDNPVTAPTGLVAADAPSDLGGVVELTWTPSLSPDVSSQKVYRSTVAGGPYSLLASLPGNSDSHYIDNGLTNKSTYYYIVTASDGVNESSRSNEAKAVPVVNNITYKFEQATFQWIDATSGTAYALEDDSSVTIPIGFAFEFYDIPYQNVTISSNGYLTFGEYGNEYNNVTLPSTRIPNNIIAPFWDDLNPQLNSGIYSLLEGTAPNRRLTIAWNNVPHYEGLNPVSFEVTLYEASKDIILQYLDADFGDAQWNLGASATVGIEDPNGFNASQSSYNQAIIQNSTAQRFYPSTISPSAPLAPTGLVVFDVAADQGNALQLNWVPSASSTVSQQRIYRSTTIGGPYTMVVQVTDRTISSHIDTGLTNGTTYYYVVRSYDGINESPNSNQASAVSQDNLAPTISNLATHSITYNSATITWTTNEASDSQVEYGTTTSYGSSTTLNTAVVTSHSVVLTNLSASTLYHYRVKSRDAAGNLATSGDFTFTTSAGTAGIDLIMMAVSGPANGQMGGAIIISNTVNNQGTNQAGVFEVRLFLSTDQTITSSDTVLGYRNLNSLAGGASDSANTSVALPNGLTPGTYYLGAIIDIQNLITETNETNNSLAGNAIAITIGEDLVITAVSGPTSGQIGGSIIISNTVQNQGTGQTGLFYVGLYLSTDATITTSDTRLSERLLSSGLAGGASSSASTTVGIPSSLTPGTYYIGAIADFVNHVPEDNETNNSLAGNTINVTP